MARSNPHVHVQFELPRWRERTAEAVVNFSGKVAGRVSARAGMWLARLAAAWLIAGIEKRYVPCDCGTGGSHQPVGRDMMGAEVLR